jgi:alpha-L-fucosidase 2
MEQYRFTGDVAFLKNRTSQLHGAAQFFVDTLVDYNGWKVNSPSLSPENEYVFDEVTNNWQTLTQGTTFDNSLIWELFGIIEDVQSEFNSFDAGFVGKVKALRAQLPPLQISKRTNGIQEWIHDYNEVCL